jgi:hypothetical protein
VTTMLSWEMILVLPPLVRFFMGFFLILVFTGGSVLVFYWLGKGEEE